MRLPKDKKDSLLFLVIVITRPSVELFVPSHTFEKPGAVVSVFWLPQYHIEANKDRFSEAQLESYRMILEVGHDYDFKTPGEPSAIMIWFRFSYRGVSRKEFIERRLYDIKDPIRLRSECIDAASEIVQVASEQFSGLAENSKLIETERFVQYISDQIMKQWASLPRWQDSEV